MIEVYSPFNIKEVPPNTLYRIYYSKDRWSTFRKCKKISKLHCETGPACMGPYNIEGYWLDGKIYSKKNWEKEIYNRRLKKILK